LVKYDHVPSALQRHWSVHGARMADRETYKGQDIFYGDGGPHHDAKDSKNLEPDDEWMRKGYFIAVFGLMKGKAVIGFPAYFKLNHDMHLNNKERKKARLAAVRFAAHEAVDAMLNVGLLERYEGSILIPNSIH